MHCLTLTVHKQRQLVFGVVEFIIQANTACATDHNFCCYLFFQRHGLDGQMLNVAIRCASTSVAQRSSGGFWTWLTGARSNALPPPDFTLPGVTIPPPLPDLVEPGKTKITTLANGVKIASETTPVCAPHFYDLTASCMFLWAVSNTVLLCICFTGTIL